MCYHFGNFLFTGDTVLCNDVGPTHYEESEFGFNDGITYSLEELKASVKRSIFPLSRETTILPGHGPFSSVGAEVLYNKVVGEASEKKYSV